MKILENFLVDASLKTHWYSFMTRELCKAFQIITFTTEALFSFARFTIVINFYENPDHSFFFTCNFKASNLNFPNQHLAVGSAYKAFTSCFIGNDFSFSEQKKLDWPFLLQAQLWILIHENKYSSRLSSWLQR